MVTIQESKIDSSIATSELFPESCSYSVYRKDLNLHGGGVMLLVHKYSEQNTITDLDNNLESVWVKVFVNKTSHYVTSWYRQPNGTVNTSGYLETSLSKLRNMHKSKKHPSA